MILINKEIVSKNATFPLYTHARSSGRLGTPEAEKDDYITIKATLLTNFRLTTIIFLAVGKFLDGIFKTFRIPYTVD